MTAPADPVVARLRAAGCVFAEDEAALLRDAAGDATELDRMLTRRESGEPLEVIVGWAEFRGRRVIVAPGVFVPRLRSELLVQEAVAIGASYSRPRTIVELCCGVGAVSHALAYELPDAVVFAADIDPAAVAVARLNVPAPPDRPRVFEGDLYDALPAGLRGGIDILIANAPYVPTDEIANMPPEARDHEPRIALDGGADGLDVQRRIAASARDWLASGGALLIETSVRQAPATAELMRAGGLEPRVVHDEDLDATVVIGRAPGRLPCLASPD